MAKRKGPGKWVWVPLEKWELQPASFYSMQKSLIVCTLFHRDIRPDLYAYCLANDVLPPSGLRKARLEDWIEQHRTSSLALVKFPSSDATAGADGRRKSRDRQRREFFRQLARGTLEATR